MTTGEVIWTRDGITSINRVYFDKDDEKVVVGCMYGEDIFFPNDKIAQIGDKQVECPSFAFIGAIGTPEGVLLVPAREGLMLCDKGGNLIWENCMMFRRRISQKRKGHLNFLLVELVGAGSFDGKEHKWRTPLITN